MACPGASFTFILALLAGGPDDAFAAGEDPARDARESWSPLTRSEEDQALVLSFETEEYHNNWALRAINASQAYALLRKNGLPVGGRGVVAAVSDKGVDFEHPELAGKQGPHAFMQDYSDAHGTHIAGSIAAHRDGKGMHGVAFDARVIAISEDRWDHFPAAARHPDVKVVNVSWAESDEEELRENLAQGRAQIAEAVGADTVFVVSLAQGDETRAGYPAEFAPDPAMGGRIITVVGVGPEDQLASHPCGVELAPFTLAAPGMAILAPAAARHSPGEAPEDLDGRAYFRWPGTSMAVPQVVGAVCVLRAAWPELSAEDAVSALVQTARRLGPDHVFGHGLIDLHAAVQRIGGGAGPSSSGTFVLQSEDGATARAERTAQALQLHFGDEVYEYRRATELDSEDGEWLAYTSEFEAILWPASNQGSYLIADENGDWLQSTWVIR